METIYFTLSHFNLDIQKIMLLETGYSSINDYELSSSNPLYELSWNNKTGLFVTEPVFINDGYKYYQRYIPMSSLAYDIKQYLYNRFLSNSIYRSFEDYYISNYHLISDIFVFVPYNIKMYSNDEEYYIHRSIVIEDNNVKVSIQNDVSNLLLEDYYFKLSTNGKNYVLRPKNDILEDQSKFPDRYSADGWSLIDGAKPIYFRKTSKGFVVGKKYKDHLRNLGAEYCPKKYLTVKE